MKKHNLQIERISSSRRLFFLTWSFYYGELTKRNFCQLFLWKIMFERPQIQWRPLHKAFTSGLGLDAMSFAWPAVFNQWFSLTLARNGCRINQVYYYFSHHSDQFVIFVCVFAMMHRLSWAAIMRTELFMYFCIKNYSGTRVKFVGSKRSLNLIGSLGYCIIILTVLRRWSRCCSYYVWLCGLYYGALHV